MRKRECLYGKSKRERDNQKNQSKKLFSLINITESIKDIKGEKIPKEILSLNQVIESINRIDKFSLP